MDIFVLLLLISLFSSLLAYNVFVWFSMLLQAYFAAYIGTRKVISDLNGSLGSRYFLYVMSERTSFALRASAFESSKLVIGLK